MAQPFANVDITQVSSTEALDLFDEKSVTDPKDVKPASSTTVPASTELSDEDKKKIEEQKNKQPEPTIKDVFADEEEGKDTPDDEEEVDDKPAASTGEDDKNLFASLSKELLDMGIFTLGEDEDEESFVIDNPEDFAGRWDLEKRKGAIETLQSFLQSKGEDKLEWFDAIYNKGVSPKEYMERWTAIEDLSKIDLTNQDAQERVVREALKEQGFDPEDIEAEVTRLKQIGDLESTSGRYHKALMKAQGKKLQDLKAQAEQKQQAALREKENYKTSLIQLLNAKMKEKEFDGIPITKQVADETFDYIYNTKYTLPSGDGITQFDKDIMDLKSNPELKLKVGLIMNMLKKDPQLSIIKKKAVSTESNSLFKTLANKQRKTTNTTSAASEQKVTSWFT